MAPRTTAPIQSEEHHFSISALITLVIVLLILGGIVVYNRINTEVPVVVTPVEESKDLTEAEKADIAANSKANDTLTEDQKERASQNTKITNPLTAEEKARITGSAN